ncbi:MAG: hypothetical protein ACLFQB_07700 [Chitinispirillaceae bacterium]
MRGEQQCRGDGIVFCAAGGGAGVRESLVPEVSFTSGTRDSGT